MSELTAFLNVNGYPASQGSHSAYVNKHTMRAVVLHGSSNVERARLAAWRGGVTAEARRWMAINQLTESPWDRRTPLFIAMFFRLARPKSMPAQVGPKEEADWLEAILHERRPDLDKVVRSTNDALTASQLIVDDSRCSGSHAWKRFARIGEPTGAEIIVRRATAADYWEAYECWAS